MNDFRLHNVAIRALHLLDPRVETTNFRKKLLHLLTSLAREEYELASEERKGCDDDWTLEESLNSYHCISLLKNDFRDIPDAFVIDKEREEILIFEVEDSHPMPACKAWRTIDLADSISWELDWTVRVFVSDRYANLTEIDVEVLQSSMVHEFGQKQLNKQLTKQKVDWHPRCMSIRHSCRKCGKIIRGKSLYEHRYDCNKVNTDKEDI